MQPLKKFDSLSVRIKKLEGCMAKVAQLSAEYAALMAEKKEKYEEYKAARKEMIDFQTAKNNVDRILGVEPPGQEQKKQQETQH